MHFPPNTMNRRIRAVAIFNPAENPWPTNSAALSTPPFRRLLLDLYLATYKVDEQDREAEILSIGRSPHPR
jgi:hypothetical protein